MSNYSHTIFAAGLPQLPVEQRSRIIGVRMDITRGMIGSLNQSAPANRSALIEELVRVPLSYLKAKLAGVAQPLRPAARRGSAALWLTNFGGI
jgi:hypothetical protein